MSSSKRRKISSVEPQALSAVARRKLESASASRLLKPLPSDVPHDENLFDGTLLTAERSNVIKTIRSGNDPISRSVESLEPGEDVNSDSYEHEDNAEVEVAAGSSVNRGASLFTTLKPSKSNIKYMSDGSLTIRIVTGERVVVLGQYGLSVMKGAITLLGATLRESDIAHRVYSFTSHSLPVIRCSSSDCNEAELKLHPLSSGLPELENLSPLFQRLTVDPRRNVLGQEQANREVNRDKSLTFQLIFTNTGASNKIPIWPLVSPPEWNETLASLASANNEPSGSTVTMICGPKSSGKSTFSTLFMNRLLTEATSKAQRGQGVAFLDLDPGQPEYSTPGQISLMHLKEPNFGPSFTHPTVISTTNKVIRSHFIGAITPSADSDRYTHCVLDLIAYYRRLLGGYPLVINTPGWIQGTGLELLVDLIRAARPTEVIYMSTEGPLEVVAALREVAGETSVLTLPSQQKEYMTRTAAQLRIIQTMSYFHLKSSDKKERWDTMSLTSVAPLEVQYSGKDAGILGITCLGEIPALDMLKDTISGSLVAIVVIESMSALQCRPINTRQPFRGKPQTSDTSDFITVDCGDANSSVEEPLPQFTKENLPYLDNSKGDFPDARSSHCIGIALVRGIDTSRQRLQLLTPVSSDTIQDLQSSGKHIILVSGKLDTPGWAYTEELYRRESEDKRRVKETATGNQKTREDTGVVDVKKFAEPLNEKDVDFSQAPWVEKLSGDQGRGAMNRVWRVRRDLGKSA